MNKPFWKVLLLSLLVTLSPPHLVTPSSSAAERRFGWAGPAIAEQALRQHAQQLPPLRIAAGNEIEGKTVALWHFAKRVNGGKHFTNVAQQRGDCVSWGWTHGCEYSAATAIAMGQTNAAFRWIYPPYIYGTSRVFAGQGQIRGDGSTGAWAAIAVERYGILAANERGVPAYGRTIAGVWGAPPGPPKEFVEIAKANRAQGRRVEDFLTAAQAISNGWAVPVCSSAGFDRIVEANGRIEGRWTSTWPHCMCFIAFDGRAGREALYCLNSWGPNAHAPAARYAQLDGAPPGGFWVTRKDADRMLGQRDSYAVSFNGFRKLDVFGWLNPAGPVPEEGEDRANDPSVSVPLRLPAVPASERPATVAPRSRLRDGADRSGAGVWHALAI